MIRRLLIANRGEIAVRVARTAREMGIETVGVYAEADAGAFHTRNVDRAVSLGPGTPAETYLSIGRLLEAARDSGADAVHPGYGFLSENADFARAVIEAGLTWVGPPPAAIEAMGDKLRARAAMEKAGVPVVPGSPPGAARSGDTELLAEARRLGFPLLIKASAGGGGKGMSRVDADRGPARPRSRRAAGSRKRRSATARCTSRGCSRAPATSSSRSSATRRGITCRLFERECSVQRRHQKIVEETPSPALERARCAGPWGRRRSPRRRRSRYVGAGTVEFLVDESGGRFYFLEMNTRLQVEHPITEETLGCDLVRAQLEVAAGGQLPASWRDGSLRPRGHAIELRLYAEDPVEFLPRSGRLLVYREPTGPGVRVDAGVEEGALSASTTTRCSPSSSSRAETREAAIARAKRALEDWIVLGVETNARLLAAVLALAGVRIRAATTTDLVAQLPPLDESRPEAPDAAWIAAALAPAAAGRGTGARLGHVRAGSLERVPLLEARRMKTVRLVEARTGRAREVRLDRDAASIDGRAVPFACRAARARRLHELVVDGRRFRVAAARSGRSDLGLVRGRRHRFEIGRGGRLAASAEHHGGGLAAPMPGRVRRVVVTPGAAVRKGDVLLVLEAMKMEHAIRAPHDGVLERLHVAEGDLVEAGVELAEIAES